MNNGFKNFQISRFKYVSSYVSSSNYLCTYELKWFRVKDKFFVINITSKQKYDSVLN